MKRRISVDPTVFIGEYPYRDVPHPDPEPLIRVMHREGIEHAWVGHLPAPFQADPAASNSELVRLLGTFREKLSPVLAINPALLGWEHALDQASRLGVPAIRTYPAHWKLSPEHAGLRALAIAAGDRRMPLILTVRFEDLRQRDARDTAGDLSPQVVRTLARLGPQVRLVVCSAGKEFIEEVHWGLTPEEQQRVIWDISWIWGPPEDHLAKLFRLIGPERFAFGSQWPLRLVQSPFANLELLPDDLDSVAIADPAHLFP
jgi:hypothetical protein